MPTIWTLQIPGWMPATVNQLLTRHWAAAGRLKKRDKEVLGNAILAYGVPRAERRRCVSLLVVLPKGQRAPDRDALYKSTLDALVCHGALKNDSPAWCVLDGVQYARGEVLVTYLTIREMS